MLFSRKLEHIKANPKVSVSLSDPVAMQGVPFHRAVIQGDARVLTEEDPHTSWEALLPLWRAKEPSIDFFVKRRFGIPLFFERHTIAIEPKKVFLWADGDTSPRPRSARRASWRCPDGHALAPAEAVTRARTYPHGGREAVEKAAGTSSIVSWVGADGYPMTIAAPHADNPDGELVLGPLPAKSMPPKDTQVGVIFSHIRPVPNYGYDEPLRQHVGPGPVEGRPAAVRPTRATGWDEAETPFFEYAERTVPEAHRYMGELGAKPRLSAWWTFFLTTRASAPHRHHRAGGAGRNAFAWGWFLLALLGGVLIHLGLNMANDLFDDASGADAANVTPTPFSGGSRVIQYGLVSRRGVLVAATSCYVAGVAIGLGPGRAAGWGLLWIGAVGVAISLAYFGPAAPPRAPRLGEVVTALGFGPVTTLGTYYVLRPGLVGRGAVRVAPRRGPSSPWCSTSTRSPTGPGRPASASARCRCAGPRSAWSPGTRGRGAGAFSC